MNSTAAPAKVLVNPEPGAGDLGIGVLMAKATFRFDVRGRVEMDTQTPWPLLSADLAHPLGLLPADRLSSRGTKMEVMLLGHAYPKGGAAATSTEVKLSVGKMHRQIAVFGDRSWLGRSGAPGSFRGPDRFERMPLVYERAFGGSQAVQLDKETVIDVCDPVNKRGRGFDAYAWADGMAKLLGAPAGYPMLPGYRRDLPNLENPASLITRQTDAPEPVGWAPAPPDIAVSQLHVIRRATASFNQQSAKMEGDPGAILETANAHGGDDPDEGHYRAHSDLVIEMPAMDAPVRLENLLADARVVELRLPRLRLVADYVIYGRRGERELRPYALLLLPDEKSFSLTYGRAFTFERGPANERSFRLRTAEGWFDGVEGGAA